MKLEKLILAVALAMGLGAYTVHADDFGDDPALSEEADMGTDTMDAADHDHSGHDMEKPAAKKSEPKKVVKETAKKAQKKVAKKTAVNKKEKKTKKAKKGNG